jgi:hypothetical protein
VHLPTHLVLSWLLGHRLSERRDRRLVAWAGVAPDLDALTVLGGLDFYGQWHHVLTHGLTAALVFAASFPFSRDETFTPYGWTLGSWQNIAITAAAFVLVGAIGVRRGWTAAECVLSAKADRAVVETLRRRFGPSRA